MISDEYILKMMAEYYGHNKKLSPSIHEEFINYLIEDIRKFVQKKGIVLPDFSYTDVTTDFILIQGYGFWKRNLRGKIVGMDSEVELIYTENGEWQILENTLAIDLPGSNIFPQSKLKDLIWQYSPNPYRDDHMLCIGMGEMMLEMDRESWEQKKNEYLEDPSKFEDITLYDEDGQAYIIHDNERLYHPDIDYEHIISEDTSDDWVHSAHAKALRYQHLNYSDLVYDNIYPLLGLNKFVKKL